MSSSKGNVVLIGDLTQNIGADMVRFFLMNFVEPWQEANWKQQDVEAGLRQLHALLDRFFALGPKIKGSPLVTKATLSSADRWMLGRLHTHLRAGTAAMEDYQLRKFLQELAFQLMTDLRWYERRQPTMTPGKKAVYKHLLDIWTRSLAPVMPHTCEEIWHVALGNKTFVTESPWPLPETRWTNAQADAQEALVMRLVEDTRNVFTLVKIHPKKVTLFVADAWKYTLFAKLQKEVKKSRDIGTLLKKVMNTAHASDISRIVPGLVKDPSRLPATLLPQKEELKTLTEAKAFFSQEWGVPVEIARADGKDGKARQALPGKPAILVE